MNAPFFADLNEAARDSVTASIRLTNTPCDCALHEWYDNTNDETLLRAVFAINGRRMTVDSRQPGRASEAHYAALASAVAQSIAAEILAKPMAEAMCRRFGRG